MIDLKILDKLFKKPKIVAVCVLLFWVLLVSININKVLNVSEFVEDESSNLSTSEDTEANQGTEILSIFSEANSSFQVLIHNPEGSILTEEGYQNITDLIYNITHNPKIGPYLSPSKPYSSIFDDADNLLRSILSIQWFATQMSFASVHSLWGSVDYFSNNWISQYNISNDVEVATTTTKLHTFGNISIFLNSNNESRYQPTVESFLDLFAENFQIEANASIPTTSEEVLNISKSIVQTNNTIFETIANSEREKNILLEIAGNFNESYWQNSSYIYEKITKILFNSTKSVDIDFVQEVYQDGVIEGFIEAKNKYLLPILRLETSIPPISNEIIETFLKQYTNYETSINETDTTIITFNLAINHLNEKGKEAYIELLNILPILKETYSPLEVHMTGIDLFIIEVSADYIQQANKTDIIVIVTIIVILILVYRSPILPLIQIFVLGISLGVARLVFILIGTNIGGLDTTSLIVLSVSLLGATTDYCVFLMGDYLLNLKKTENRISALKLTLKRTSKSIVIASVSLTFGFGALIISSFAMATGMGIGGAIGFLTSMIVSLTLVPAILTLINENILNKWKLNVKLFKKRKFPIMKYVKKAVQNPKKILVISFILALVGTGIFLIIPTDYAQISTAPKSYSSRQGIDAIDQFMGTEYISQVVLLFQSSENDPFMFENQSLNFVSINHVLNIVEEIRDKTNIKIHAGISHPLGVPYMESLQNSSLFLSEEILILMKNFVFSDTQYCIVSCGSEYPEGDKLLDDQIITTREIINDYFSEEELSSWNSYVTGFAPVLYDAKTKIAYDFNLIFVFASLTIILLLFLFLRDFFMSVRVLVTILLSLGISLGVFSLLGYTFLGGQIYWMVPLMLYAVLTALGLDFDVLFLGIFGELYKEKEDAKTAIVEAVSQTMGNISIAGLIMAATYLSLVFTSSIHMQQLGLGLGIGILIDVFVSRLFIVPPAIAVTFRAERKRKRINKKRSEKSE